MNEEDDYSNLISVPNMATQLTDKFSQKYIGRFISKLILPTHGKQGALMINGKEYQVILWNEIWLI